MKVYPKNEKAEKAAQWARMSVQDKIMRQIALVVAFGSVFGIILKILFF